MLIESEGRCGLHLQQPVDLLERGSMTLAESFVDNRSNIPNIFKDPKETRGGELT